jgi:purine nucleosidase
MSKPIPLILDCDPGIDDFLAILMILAAPERFNLLGISVTGGNVPLKYTVKNALKACELAGRREVKVYAGCPYPLLRPLELQDEVHGETGLKGYDLPEPTMKVQETHGVDFLIDTIMNSTEKVTLATTAPLTNVALAIVREPRILENIEEIVTMGGSMGLGNITPAAEYNFYADPDAAYILYTCGKKITTVSIDITHTAVTSLEWLKHIETLGLVGEVVSKLLRPIHEWDVSNFETEGGAIHDPCVIGYLLDPTLFKGQDVHVEINKSFDIGRGRSIVDWWHKRDLPANAHYFNEIDSKGFYRLLTSLIERLQQPSKQNVGRE